MEYEPGLKKGKAVISLPKVAARTSAQCSGGVGVPSLPIWYTAGYGSGMDGGKRPVAH